MLLQRLDQALDPAGFEPVARGHADHQLFQVADVAMHVPPTLRNFDDGITDDLTGAVVRDIAAAIHPVDSDSATL